MVAGGGLEEMSGGRFEWMTGGKFVLTVGATAAGIGGRFGFETTPVADQSGGNDSSGEVAQPARKISAQKMIPAILNTRQLCGTQMRTQAVLVFS
jgi:hypothetical protein